MLFDTDVLIWFLRGHEGALRTIEDDDARVVSVVSRMELVQGARSLAEARLVGSLLAEHAFRSLPLTENAGQRALVYMEEHGLRCGLDIPDALIAATAVEYGLVICTANVRHFRPITELQVRPFLP